LRSSIVRCARRLLLAYTNETKDLYKRLGDAGFKPPWVRSNVLPDWWEDGMASNPAMRQQAEIILSRFLGVPPGDLASREKPISVDRAHNVKFKQLKGGEKAKLGPAFTTIRRAAEVALRCLTDDVREPVLRNNPPHSLRKSILGEADYVSFKSLLDSCWDLGVPVLRVRDLPPGSGKLVDGAAMNCGGRPVIIVTTHRTSAGFLAWILGHEMGHVALKHLDEGPILDAHLMRPNTSGDDPAEDEANRFAARLVFGDDAFEPSTSYWPTGDQLARLARAYGAKGRIDPSVVVTAWARTMSEEHNTSLWGVATNALKKLGADFTEGSTIRDRMRRHLDSSKVSESDAHFLAQVSGLGATW